MFPKLETAPYENGGTVNCEPPNEAGLAKGLPKDAPNGEKVFHAWRPSLAWRFSKFGQLESVAM